MELSSAEAQTSCFWNSSDTVGHSQAKKRNHLGSFAQHVFTFMLLIQTHNKILPDFKEHFTTEPDLINK